MKVQVTRRKIVSPRKNRYSSRSEFTLFGNVQFDQIRAHFERKGVYRSVYVWLPFKPSQLVQTTPPPPMVTEPQNILLIINRVYGAPTIQLRQISDSSGIRPRNISPGVYTPETNAFPQTTYIEGPANYLKDVILFARGHVNIIRWNSSPSVPSPLKPQSFIL